MINRIVAF